MEFGIGRSGKPRRPFPSLPTTITKPGSSQWLSKVSSKCDNTSSKKDIDEYDISRVDEVDNEVEYLRETTRLPKATATIQEQRSLRKSNAVFTERNGRRLTRDDDLDRQLKELKLYEEGMTQEVKIQILNVVKESKDSAENEKSFREGNSNRRSGRGFSDQSYEEDRHNSSRSDDDTKRVVSPEMVPEEESSPVSNRRDIPSNKRLTRTKKRFNLFSEDKRSDTDTDSEVEFPPLTVRIGTNFSTLQRTETPKLPIAKSEDTEPEDTSDNSSNTSFGPKALPKRSFYGSSSVILPVSRTVQPRPTRTMAKTSLCLRQSPMVNQLSNIWFGTPDYNKEGTLPMSRKRKLASERYKDKTPYYCPMNGDPKKYALQIKRSIEEHHRRLRAYQSQSLTLMPWSEPITKVFKYTIRSTSTSSFQDKMKKETETTVLEDEDTTNNTFKEVFGQAHSNSIHEKKSSRTVSNPIVIPSESLFASDNSEPKEESILKLKPLQNYGFARRKRALRADSDSSQMPKIPAILDDPDVFEPSNKAQGNRLFLRQHVRPQETNNRTNGTASMLVEPLDLESSESSQQSTKDEARQKEQVFDKLLRRTATDAAFDDEDPLPIEVLKESPRNEKVTKRSITLRKRTRGNDVSNSPKFNQEVPIKNLAILLPQVELTREYKQFGGPKN